MKKRRVVVTMMAIVALLSVGAWVMRSAEAADVAPYRFATVERGDLEDAVSATGTLNAVRTVQIGTQVSGKVMELYADFNDKVRKGQLLARIDPTIQQQQVRNAAAALERVQAGLLQAQRDYTRNKTLYDQKVITETEFNQVEYALTVARSNVTSAQVQLEQARQNLAYTEIYAPIDGIVVERNAEQGQTVAASLSAPQLFLVAQDLTQMEILAAVDESDIGQIEAGQTVRFSVSAYPDEQFEGTVRQVRLSSATANNVVNYTAVVSVTNPDGRLLPGMTATVDFLVRRAADVLKVSNAALRFRPTNEQRAKMGIDTTAAVGRAVAAGGPQRPAGAAQGGARGARTPPADGARPTVATLYYVKDGKVATARVRTGISDGSQTEIQGAEVAEGLEVISGLNQASGAQAGTTNPFQQQPQQQAGPGGFGGGGGPR